MTCEAGVIRGAGNRVSTPVAIWGRQAKFSSGRFASPLGVCGFVDCYKRQGERNGGSDTIVVNTCRHHCPAMKVALALDEVEGCFAFVSALGIDSEECLFN